jgi:signal peptidase I
MAKKKRRSAAPGGDRNSRRPDGTAEEVAGVKGGARGPRSENTLMEWIKSFGIALVLFLIIRSFLVHTFVIISGSMEETLLVGDLLLVNRAAVGSKVPGTPWRVPGYSKVERGDILVFDPPHEEDLKLVKRLMGLPGDTIEMRDKVFYVTV